MASHRKGLLFTAAAATAPPGWQPSANAAIYRSDNGGSNWTQLEKGLPVPFHEMARPMAVNDGGSVYAAAGKQLFVSKDDGGSWELLAENLPYVHAMVA